MTLTVAFLLGQRPSAASVLPEVIESLRRAGATVSTWVDGAGAPTPDQLPAGGVVVLRGLAPRGLLAAGRLETAGARCCNSVAATALASDKGLVHVALTGAGVRVPPGTILSAWAEVIEAGHLGPVAVKALDGRGGLAVVLAERRQLRTSAPFPGPYLVQERLPHPGPDRKIFVIGGHLWGVLRPWPPSAPGDKRGRAFCPTADEVALATQVGRTLGLEVYGVDVVPTVTGPVMVDVNPFPGFKGAEGAASALADHLLALAHTEASP